MRYVINSSDTNEIYSFFIPIVSLLWRERGFTPIILLVGTREQWNSTGKNKSVLHHIEKAEIKVHFVKPVQNYKNSTIAQVSRLFACADPNIKPEDYILISDADMLPMSRTWFTQYDASKAFNFFGGNAYLGYIGDASPSKLPTRLPMCYIGGSTANWRQVMGINDLNIQTSMEKIIKEREATGCRDEWFYDEHTFANKMFKSPLITNSQFINRDWTHGRASNRLDRDNWHFNNQKDIIDCHYLRPATKFIDELFRILIPEVYCYPGHIQWIRAYINNFISS